jgi:hypothetical protein
MDVPPECSTGVALLSLPTQDRAAIANQHFPHESSITMCSNGISCRTSLGRAPVISTRTQILIVPSFWFALYVLLLPHKPIFFHADTKKANQLASAWH